MEVCAECGSPIGWSTDGLLSGLPAPFATRSRYPGCRHGQQDGILEESKPANWTRAPFRADGKWIAFRPIVSRREFTVYIAPFAVDRAARKVGVGGDCSLA